MRSGCVMGIREDSKLGDVRCVWMFNWIWQLGLLLAAEIERTV